MNNILEELGIPKKCVKPSARDNLFIAVVDKAWLKSLAKDQTLAEFVESSPLDVWPTAKDVDSSWTQIFIQVYKKGDAKVIPLPHIRAPVEDEDSLLFSQLIQYVSLTNYKNLWKETYKKSSVNCENINRETQVNLVNFDDVLRETIVRMYGCPIVNIFKPNLNTGYSKSFDAHLNILPAICAVETFNSIFLLHSKTLDYNLNDCVAFSPEILNKCFAKPLFIVYQLLQVMKSLHQRSLTLGDVSLDDIYLAEDLWIHVIPSLSSNIYVQKLVTTETKSNCTLDCSNGYHKFDFKYNCEFCGFKTYDKVQVTNQSPQELCELWIEGQISNFTYISILNKLSGRKLKDPNCHYVFPWVTDFSSPCGKNWRDLKKSKYRLNKGDRQLDLTYEDSEAQVPHHVSDVLSSITYYVYMARCTPKSVLCKNVRTMWVPAEYPISIQRLQEWTPDECIPEFFTDPTIFRSIHNDLDDLEVPAWCSGPEDFIQKHREALESTYVSSRLHHWIDLTFGFKLTGDAAIKSKNVCLHLVDDHSKIMNCGIVQLFSQPHPSRRTPLLFWSKLPPKTYLKPACISQPDKPVELRSDDEHYDNHFPDTPNGSAPNLSSFLSRSRSSLIDDQIKQPRFSGTQRSSSLGPKNPSFTSHVTANPKSSLSAFSGTSPSKEIIQLSKEYKLEQALEFQERKHNFLVRTFHPQQEDEAPSFPHASNVEVMQVESDNVQNSFTNLMFGDKFEGGVERRKTPELSAFYAVHNNHRKLASIKRNDNQINCNYSEIISSRKGKELQIFACLVVEIFMSRHLRALGTFDPNLPFEKRLKYCTTVVRNCATDIPSCISHVVQILLQEDLRLGNSFWYNSVNNFGLPPLTTHLLLSPHLHCLIPFPKLFPSVYKLISSLEDFTRISEELNVLYYFKCNGEVCSEYRNLEQTKISLTEKIAECQIKSCVKHLDSLIDNVNTTRDLEILGVLLPYIKTLIENPSTAVLAAWYLFDPITKVVGPQETAENFLQSILKLYEYGSNENLLPFNGKFAKLYHHSFLLRLMVRFGLKCFLDNFITPLVEAVGGYRNCEDDILLHTHCKRKSKRVSNLRTMDEENLPGNDDSGRSSEMQVVLSKGNTKSISEPEIFDFEEEPEIERNAASVEDSMSLNNDSECSFNPSTAEEALNVEDVGLAVHDSSEGIKIDNICTVSPVSLDSGAKHSAVTDIKCDFGSKISDCEFQVIPPEVGMETTTISSNKEEISDMSSDSLIWLSHRLGPVLTARYLSRNLLKMLTLCYVGRENLVMIPMEQLSGESKSFVTITNYVMGDQNASKVMACLTNIAGLYGEQMILLQYIPHATELISLCKRKLTHNLEGGLISCLALLKSIIPYLSDSTLMDQLQDVIIKRILRPIVRLLGSTNYVFPNGQAARNVLARKYLDTVYILSVRMGSDLTRAHFAVPALQSFFLIFEKSSVKERDVSKTDTSFDDNTGSAREEPRFGEQCQERTTSEWTIGDDSDPSCLSPLASSEGECMAQALAEIQSVFTAKFAFKAYTLFAKYVGRSFLETCLTNNDRVMALCEEYEQNERLCIPQAIPKLHLPDVEGERITASSSIGSNIALVGNRIDVQREEVSNVDSSVISSRMENSNRHLRGNWLAYWEHEIGRSDKDTMFNFKQIKLQTFAGHSHGVKCMYVLDNENSFISASRDKTVKLWSLRSQGDGSSTTTCQWTYTSHKKSVLSITFIESMRVVGSCDGAVHFWDPFLGVTLGHLESPKYAPVNVLKCMPAPSTLFFAATTDGTIKVVDTKSHSYIHELKININPAGLIRCMAVAPSGSWLAAGQASGAITVLDNRTGLVISTWKAHEGEVLQLVALDDATLISASLDQTISVWNVSDGKFKFPIRGTTEPVHCLNVYHKELISGTTANRIGVHTSIGLEASFSSTKLRSDAFKGLLTSMVVLPLNRLLLLGSDAGNIYLLC